MADTAYLKQRRQGWYFQLTVPADVRSKWDRPSPIIASLKTRDLSKAQQLRWELLARFNREFQRIRNSATGWTPEEIEEEAEALFQEQLVMLEAEGLDEDGCNSIVDVEAHRIESGKLSEPDEAFAWAKLEAANARRAALAGEAYQRKPLAWGRKGLDPVTLKQRRVKRGGIRFSDAAKRYLEEAQRDASAKLTEQTKGQYEAAFRLFSGWAGDVSLDEIAKPKAAAFLDTIATLSPHWGRHPDTKKRTFADIVKEFGKHPTGLAPRTLNRYAVAMGLVWEWAGDRLGYEGTNPWKGQQRQVGEKRKTEKLPFTLNELKKLLAVKPDVKSAKRSYGATLRWVSWISAFSGMRLNEVCSLRRADLKKIGNVWVMDIKDAKTEAGDRIVPVHSKLVALGLIEYRKSLREDEEWLFPKLLPGGPDNKRSWYLSKRFTDYRRKLGVIRLDDKTGKDRVDFHSFRRAVIACLEEKRIPQSEVAQVVGHEREGITFAVYNPGGLGVKALKDVVEKIGYRGVK
jgi:integrase